MAGNLDSILGRLKRRLRRNSQPWCGKALCPAHEDRNPSLSVHERDGRILLHCHAGCTPEAVCTALGIELRDVCSPQPHRRILKRASRAKYDYVDEHGKLVFQVVRYGRRVSPPASP